jgi:predicted Zn finger-like uncharacterized protein
MFTVCPKCALTLVVTAADLRVAQGYVRCGRCLNVFNALARLSEDRPGAASPPAPAPAPAPAATTANVAPEEAAPAEQAAASSTIDDTGAFEFELDASVLVTETRAPAAPSPPATVADEQPPAEAIATEPPQSAASEEPAAPAGPAAPAQPTAAVPGDGAGHSTAAEGIALAAPGESAEDSAAAPPPQVQETNTPPPASEGGFEIEMRRPRAGLAWTLGTAALAIALALQIVNHYRDALATHPALRGPLRTVYSALGVTLAPGWNVHAYEVRQLGASAAGAAAGEIVVRASVKNSASRAQPLPLLRVTLQDRFGNRIAARDVPPGDYLPSPAAPGALLAAGSRVDATMVFVDPGPQAVGFEIDACLRQRGGAVACAHGP